MDNAPTNQEDHYFEVMPEVESVTIPKDLLRHIFYFEQIFKTLSIVLSQQSQESSQLAENIIQQLLKTSPDSETVSAALDAVLLSPQEALQAYKSMMPSPILKLDD